MNNNVQPHFPPTFTLSVGEQISQPIGHKSYPQTSRPRLPSKFWEQRIMGICLLRLQNDLHYEWLALWSQSPLSVQCYSWSETVSSHLLSIRLKSLSARHRRLTQNFLFILRSELGVDFLHNNIFGSEQDAVLRDWMRHAFRANMRWGDQSTL